MTSEQRGPAESLPAIGVLGMGNWGTALADHLARKGCSVRGWSIDPRIVENINTRHRHPNALTEVNLHQELRVTANIAEALQAELIVLAVPSSALHSVCDSIVQDGNLHRPKLFVSVIKGLDPETLETPLQLAEERLGRSHRFVVLSGPSFAKDVAAGRPCSIVAGGRDNEAVEYTARTFSNECMRVYFSDDPLGVELGGILKNVIALAAGVCDGLGLGESARASLITRGLAEMMRLATAMGAQAQTLAGLSGLGDLSMTATSTLSRNHTVGVRLGKGEELQAIITSLGSVAEGVGTTPLALRLATKYGVELPIAEAAGRLLRGELSPQDLARGLMLRPLKREF